MRVNTCIVRVNTCSVRVNTCGVRVNEKKTLTCSQGDGGAKNGFTLK